MLENFREIYDEELKHYSGLETLILSSQEMRMFVYEVCKNCIASQLAKEEETHGSVLGKVTDNILNHFANNTNNY